MAAKKIKSKVTLTGKQVSALAACIAAIAIISLAAGYITGRMVGDDTAEIKKDKEATEDVFGGMSPRFLDPAEVEKKTTFEKQSADSFSFHKKLEKETAPANKPLPKSLTPVDSKRRDTKALKKPKPSPKTKQAPAKKAKTARKHSKPKPARQPVVVSKKATGKKLTIQVGSFKQIREARALAKKLGKKGYKAYVVPFKFKGETWSRVRVGLFDSVVSAKKTARKLEREQKLPALLVSYQSGKQERK
ncbi:hypothetical protein MNBD_NITROSPINAE03-1984 [hydrothermal vent metagenome]|uniref:SPOR domain-containing protein n=1 Tax=hydrothermal vent metagenome TaxID=652676 RepID=A0A3B1C4Z0_9ZZZZ